MTRRYRPHGEGSASGAEEHALALESAWSRNAYGTRHTKDLYEVMRNVETRLGTITSLRWTEDGAWVSLRTSRVGASRFFTSPKVTMRGRIRVSQPVCAPLSVAVSSLDTTRTGRFPGSDDVASIVPFDAMPRKARAKTRRCSGEWPRPYPQTPLSDQVERRNEMRVRRKYRIHPLHPTSKAIPPAAAASIQMASDQSLSESHPPHLSAAIARTYRTAIQVVGRYG